MKIDCSNKEIINSETLHRIHDARFYNIEYSYKKNELKFFLVHGFFGENFEITFKNLLSVNMNNDANFLETISKEDVNSIFLNDRNLDDVPIIFHLNKVSLEHIIDIGICMSDSTIINIACEKIEFVIMN